MAGGSLLDLKRRIKSVTNTQKITKAMGLIATSKFKRVRDRADKTTPYFDTFRESVEKLALSPDMVDSVYFRINDTEKDVYVVITSDSGTCGSYNMNVINEAASRIVKDKDSLITVGEKGRNFFKKRSYETMAEFIDIGDSPSFKEATEIVRPAITAFEEGKVRNVYIIYTKFHSPIKQTVETIKILPFERPEGKPEGVLFEPSQNEVFDYVLPKYLGTTIFYTLANSIASEISSRMNAMDNATKNAGDLLDALKLHYNRVRQGNITREITEIVGGAEALKG